MHYYSLYDLPLCSELFLENVSATKILHDGHDPLKIIFAKVAAEGINNPLQSSFAFQNNAHEFWLSIPSIGRFLVKNGQEIIIDPQPGIDEASLGVFVLSVCIEMALRQRNFFIAPGFALKVGDHASAVIGAPGQGYAMLQGGLFKNNDTFVTTSLIVLNAAAEVLPGVAQLEFWPEIASWLGFNLNTLKTLRPAIEKSIVPLEKQFYAKKLPLKTIYILKQRKEAILQFIPVENAEKMHYLLQAMKHHPSAYYSANDVLPNINNIDVVLMQIPAKGMKLQNLVDTLKNHMSNWAGNYVISE